MRRERKQDLFSEDESTRIRQESDEVLSTTSRLLKEMQSLIDESKRLQQRQRELLEIRKASKKR
jgi:hypothetical protein